MEELEVDKKLVLLLLRKYQDKFIILKEKNKEKLVRLDDIESMLKGKKTVILHFDKNIVEVVD